MTNRLASATSPYLRQHADNPVEWHPWGEEAFQIAQERDVPILLSVGYSSCHWCHVMAHESFENSAVAEIMNQLFVNIKVDREERPDIDAIYMQAVQALTGRGGWPMTVFLTPAGLPFFGGTYFPPEDRPGTPSFSRLLHAVNDAWQNRRDELFTTAQELTSAIGRVGVAANDDFVGPTFSMLDDALPRVLASFDADLGGFGSAPKFPQAMTLDFCLRSHQRTGSRAALAAATISLDAMAAGGMYDQVGGGFHRYSVDSHWLVPHFEKMLYDQALLVRVYLHAFQLTGQERYRRVVTETINAVLRDFCLADGGFASAEDADSEGIEGKFYVWSLSEIQECCGEDAPEVIRYFGVTEQGNFTDPHTNYSGSILYAVNRTEDRPDAVTRAIPKLLAQRSKRVRPGLDNKVVLAWNAMFLQSLTEAAAVLNQPDWMNVAQSNIKFLKENLRRADGRWLRTWSDRPGTILAFAEDYAALLEAFITLAEYDSPHWLNDARAVANQLIELFSDPDNSGFFTTGVDGETLIVRPKEVQDNASPAENSMAASGLIRLARLTGENSYLAIAQDWINATSELAAEHPSAFAYLLGAVERIIAPPIEIIVTGDPNEPTTSELINEINSRFLPNAVRLFAFGDRAAQGLPLLVDRPLDNGIPMTYVCENFACRLPTNDLDELAKQLDDLTRSGDK